MESSGIRCRSGPRRVCYREWSGVHYRDLSESLDLSAGAWLRCLMEQNGSLSHRSKRSSDVFEVADGSIVVGCLER